MQLPVQFQQVTKYYGDFCALSHISLEVCSGESMVFLGQNGAGKTTALRLLLGLIRPTEGIIKLFGQSPSKCIARNDVGYLPGEMGWPLGVRAGEWLSFLGKLTGKENPTYRFELLERLEFPMNRLKSYIGTLSQGMKRKIGIVAAMEASPKLLILDEPSNGLDPVQQRNLLELLKDRPQSMTLVLSSHNLREVIELSDRVSVFANGHLVSTLQNQFQSTEELESTYFEMIQPK